MSKISHSKKFNQIPNEKYPDKSINIFIMNVLLYEYLN